MNEHLRKSAGLLEDIRYSLRSLRRHPAFSLVAVATIALGIGASVAVFSVLSGVVLEPLAYPDSDRLVNVYRVEPPIQRGPVSKPDFLDMRERLDGAMRVVGHELLSVTAGTGQGATRVSGARVTDGFFAVLGLPPLRGRWLDTGDQSGDTNGVVISSGYWQQHLGASERAIGTELTLDGKQWTVVGIAPPAMDYPVGTDVWMPMRVANLTVERGFAFIRISGRIADDVTRAEVQARLDALASRLASEFPENHADLSLALSGMRDALVSDVRNTLWMLMVAVVLVVVVVCANVGNLLLSRQLARHRELATRAALGASASGLARQALVEALLLAGLGAIGGGILAALAIDALLAFRPPAMPRLDAVALDVRVFAFAAAAAVGTGLLCGVLPALRALRGDVARTSHAGAGDESSGRFGRWRPPIVVGQIALSMALLVSAGLLFTTLQRLAHVDPGFNTDRLLTAMIALPAPRPPGIDRQAFVAQISRNAPFVSALEERLESLPGVEDAGFIDAMPLSGNSNFSGSVRVPAATSHAQHELTVEHRWVSPGYFDAIGVPLVAGEGYRSGGSVASPLGGRIVINEKLAELLWPGEPAKALDKEIELGIVFNQSFTIGGVVGNARRALDRDPSPEIYLPYASWPSPSVTTAILRTSVEPLTLIQPLRRTVAEVDAGVPVFDLRTMDQVVAAGSARRRFALALLQVFAGATALVAAIGLYGVMAYAVSRRTREVGVRLALGAGRGRVLGAFLRDGMTMALAGVAAGVGIAFVFSRLLQDLVWGVELTAPAIYLATAGLLVSIALAASLLPAWRASRIAPVEALRHE